jgi:hypothetical protein
VTPPAQLGLPKKASLWPFAERRPPSPFPQIAPQSPHSLAGASPEPRRSLPIVPCFKSRVLRRVSGEARTRFGGGERGHRGRPDYRYLAAASPRTQRIPLAPRYFRGRRFSAPRWRRIVARGRNLYPGLNQGAPVVVHGSSVAVFKVLLHVSVIVPPLKS